MMNKYIEIEMRPATCGIGGSFSTEASFCLDNFKAVFYDIEVKIDTGCSISTIPLKRLKVSDTLRKTLKRIDIMNGTSYFLSYGIESGGLRHEIPVTDEEKMECPAMKNVNHLTDIILCRMMILLFSRYMWRKNQPENAIPEPCFLSEFNEQTPI